MSPKGHKRSFFHQHSLSIVTVVVLLTWIVLYSVSDQATHWGSFFGNAIADWSGVLLTVLATKYFYEKGSAESRRPPHPLLAPVWEPLIDHSLTIFLVITGAGWIILYIHMNSEAKWGEVVGNIVSEWTQVLALVLMTKRFIERHSKESNR
jgi:cobalamin synthase